MRVTSKRWSDNKEEYYLKKAIEASQTENPEDQGESDMRIKEVDSSEGSNKDIDEEEDEDEALDISEQEDNEEFSSTLVSKILIKNPDELIIDDDYVK